MKKVLHISYNTLPGAGTVSNSFHQEMKKRGIYSKLLVHGRNAKKEEDTIIYHNLLSILYHKITLGFNRVFKRYGVSKYFFLSLNEKKNYLTPESILEKINFKPDIIILYWTSRFVNTKTITELYKSTRGICS